MTKANRFEGSLDDFLNNLDHLEGMGDYNSILRFYEPLPEEDIKLYHHDKLVAISITGGKTRQVLGIGYAFLRKLKEAGEPLSTCEVMDRNRKVWGGSGNVGSIIAANMRNLMYLGLARTLEKDNYGLDRYEIMDTKGFHVQYKLN